MYQIIEIDYGDSELIDRLGNIARLAFAETAPNWLSSEESATELVRDCATSNKLGRVCFSSGSNTTDDPIGWIGVVKRRHVWEIHPIAVDPESQGSGAGRKLVEIIADLAKRAGASTLLAATSDETASTNLSGKNLYLDPGQRIKDLKAVDRSPFRFWESVGFTVVGLVPDEEGPGKPGIHLARHLG